MSFGFRGCGFSGRLGANPEIDTAKGVARLRVAVDQGREYTEWVSLDVFGKSFDYVSKFAKGDMVHVYSASLSTRLDEAKNVKYLNVTCSTGDLSFTPKRTDQAPGAAGDLPF